MEVVATILGENKSTNQIEYLETMTKAQIIRLLKKYLLDEGRGNIVLALAGDISEMEEKPEAKDLLTLSEWLDENHYHLDTSAKYKLANIVAQKYKDTYQKLPRKIARQDSRGKYLKKSYGFTREELSILKDSVELLKDNGIGVVRMMKKEIS